MSESVVRTDGKRKVQIDQTITGAELTVCRNGLQSVGVTLDSEMMVWLKLSIEEYFDRELERL